MPGRRSQRFWGPKLRSECYVVITKRQQMQFRLNKISNANDCYQDAKVQQSLQIEQLPTLVTFGASVFDRRRVTMLSDRLSCELSSFALIHFITASQYSARAVVSFASPCTPLVTAYCKFHRCPKSMHNIPHCITARTHC